MNCIWTSWEKNGWRCSACIPDADRSLNYLVGMVYTQLIQTLFYQADRVHRGRLPVPVHCLMDEFHEYLAAQG